MNFENKSLEETIKAVQGLRDQKVDYVLPANKLRMDDDGKFYVDENGEVFQTSSHYSKVGFKVNDHADKQIASKLGIPYSYYSKMGELMPELKAHNVNQWLARNEYSYMVRTYTDPTLQNNGTVRAFVSDSYKSIDNYDLMTLALELVTKANEEHGWGIRVDKCSLSDTNFYMKFIVPGVRERLQNGLQNFTDPNGGKFGGIGFGDGIISGFIIKNSEVGSGSLVVAPRVNILACSNGMIWEKDAYKRIHRGVKVDTGVVSAKTRSLAFELDKSILTDKITEICSPDYLLNKISEIEQMVKTKLEEPAAFIGNACDKFKYTDEEREGIFKMYMMQTSGTMFDVAQAITSFAHNLSADRKYKMESDVVSLPLLLS